MAFYFFGGEEALHVSQVCHRSNISGQLKETSGIKAYTARPTTGEAIMAESWQDTPYIIYHSSQHPPSPTPSRGGTGRPLSYKTRSSLSSGRPRTPCYLSFVTTLRKLRGCSFASAWIKSDEVLDDQPKPSVTRPLRERIEARLISRMLTMQESSVSQRPMGRQLRCSSCCHLLLTSCGDLLLENTNSPC